MQLNINMHLLVASPHRYLRAFGFLVQMATLVLPICRFIYLAFHQPFIQLISGRNRVQLLIEIIKPEVLVSSAKRR